MPGEEEIAAVIEGMLEALYEVNQYIHVDERQKTELAGIYLSTWQAVQAGDDIPTTLKVVHYPRLKEWLGRLYPSHFLKPLQETRKIGTVVCEEYSAQLQMDIFHLDFAEILQPVLDVGCGKEARLVRHLREHGVDIYGLDRMTATNMDYVCQSDWFDYPYREKGWGTILSNMAFSNHLTYAYRNHMPDFEKYLATYQQILAAILPGGSFIYAPRLPFIEQRLDNSAVFHYGLGNR